MTIDMKDLQIKHKNPIETSDVSETSIAKDVARLENEKDIPDQDQILRLAENESLQQCCLYIPKKRLQELRQLAFDMNTSRADLVRRAIEDYWFNTDRTKHEEFWNLFSDFLKQLDETWHIHPYTTMEETLAWLKEHVKKEEQERK